MRVIRRIHGIRGRLLALEARFLAGRVVTRGPVGRAAVTTTRATPVRQGELVFPRRFAWLCGLVPSDAACYAEHLRVVLAEPGMVALLAACPQAIRVVAPLCWMVGISRADYVPGERVPCVVTAPADNAPPARVVVEVDAASQVALAAPGMGWVRFIPG